MYLKFLQRLRNLITEWIPRTDTDHIPEILSPQFNEIKKLAIKDGDCYYGILKHKNSNKTCNNYNMYN